MGRPKTPDEIHTFRKSDNYRPLDKWLGRTQRATVTSVDPDQGKLTLEMESTPGSRTNVNIPVGYLSFDPTDPTKAAWKRYMPQAGDVLLVQFDTNSEARVMGYDFISYQFLTDLQSQSPFGFASLQSGEFDEKSIGDAYIKGDRNGVLFLAGGVQSVKIDKKRRDITETTSLERVKTDSSTFKRGIVKRSPTLSATEVEAKATLGIPVTSTPANAVLSNLYESTTDLRAVNSGIPAGQPIAYLSFGNVMDPDVDLIQQGNWSAAGPLGIKKFSAFSGANARLLFRVYDSTPISDNPIGTPGKVGGTSERPFECGIDQLGNTFINHGTLSVQGVQWWSPIQWAIWTTQLKLGGVNVKIGDINSATEPVVCGNLFSTATSTLGTAMEAFNAALETYNIAVAAYNAAVAACIASTQSSAGTISSSAATTMAAAAVAFIAEQVAFAAAVNIYNAAIAAYVSATAAALSTAVFISKIPLTPAPPTTPSPYQL